MRLEGHEVAEGLHIQDEGGLTTRLYRFEAGLQEFSSQAAELAEIAATVAEEWPDQLWQSQYVLAMRHRREQRLLGPLAVGEHALLMTARTEVAGLAGVGQQIVVPALVTIDASEAMMEITADQEALEHLCFDGAGNESGNIEFISMSSNALIQRTCPQVTRAIHAASEWLRPLRMTASP